MLIIVGGIIVFMCTILGYVLHGGELPILIQPTEVLIIVGAAIGSTVIGAPMSVIKGMVHMVLAALSAKPKSKEDYLEVLLLLFELIKVGRGNLLGLEEHVENPDKSEIFNRYPGVQKNHHAIDFICDTLKLQISSPLNPYDLDDLMEQDMAAAHDEELKIPGQISKIADALPGLGIVAAVLGVVITMGKLSEGKEAIGHSVAAALVGTFLGIFLAYGFISPLAAKIEANISDDGNFMKIVKTALLAFAKEGSPKVCVEFARRSIPPGIRPTFKELDEATANAGKKG